MTQFAAAESRESARDVRLVMIAALAAAVVRLIPLQFLSPLQWDELEFFRATQWIGTGRLPFRDFWEHHTPLGWYLFAPFTWGIQGDGIAAVIAMRWAQVPVWAATFWMLNRWMARRGLAAFGRWAALASLLASSFFMTAATEYRVDTVGCFLLIAALYLADRDAQGFAGALFSLAVFANLRLAPVVVVALLALRLERGAKANRLFAGAIAVLAVVLGWSAATGSLQPMWQQVVVENRLGDAYAERMPWAFLHRFLTPFGVQLFPRPVFVPSGIDLGGAVLMLAGCAGLVLALKSWRERGGLAVIALLQVTALTFIASMKFIYNYHFEVVALLMVPLAALAIEKVPARQIVIAIVVVVLCGGVFSSLFRAKELDRAYQDVIMREVHARTSASDQVWSGVAFPIRREPAYRFWFLPDLARQLVVHGHVPRPALRRAPGAIVADRNLIVWLAIVQPEYLPYVAHHYLPQWRNLLLPALSARIAPSSKVDWRVPRGGRYRVHVSPELAQHPWFRDPLGVLAYRGSKQLAITIDAPRTDDRVRFAIEGRPVQGGVLDLAEGQVLTASSTASEPLGVVVIPGTERLWFRQPPPGVSIDAETPRTTHLPSFGARIGP